MTEGKEKVQINLLYAPQGCDATQPRFENNRGQLWMHGSYKPDMHNIGMSFYSCPGNFPDIDHPDMSIYVVEPRCVSERDYDLNFISKFKYVFTWAVKAFENTRVESKIIPLHHPSLFGTHESEYDRRKQEWLPWNQRQNEIVFISNNKSSDHHSELYSLRINLADWFHSYLKNYTVSWYSQIPVKRPYYKGTIDHKFDVLKKAKFSVCTENCYDPRYSYNYLSEKLPEVWLGGAVPLYIGCYNINDFGFQPNSYIDLRHFITKRERSRPAVDFKRVCEAVDNFSEQNYNDLVVSIDYNVKQRRLFEIISEERVMEKMVDTFYNLG